MADSDAIDVAVVAKVRAIPTLAANAPGGVFMSGAPVGTPDPYVIWQLQAAKDHRVMEEDGIAFEEAHYLVKVVGRDPIKVRDAYRLIHANLQDADLQIAGYAGCMDVSRDGRVAYREPDGDEWWIHRGGIYVVSASH